MSTKQMNSLTSGGQVENERNAMANLRCQPTRRAYPQTNLQLFNHMQQEGYSAADMTLIRNAYEVATHLYAGYFIASGREQMAHVVGTAGILSSLHVPAEIVAAGLIHNAYSNGDFGVPGKSITIAKRRQIIQAVGEEVEKYIHGFYELAAYRHAWLSLLGDIDKRAPVRRYAVLILIAEQLEHRLNDGGLKQYTNNVDENGPVLVAIALRLGFPLLADEIRAIVSSPAPENRVLCRLITAINDDRSRWVPPASCRRRVTVIVRIAINRGFRLLSRNKLASRVIGLARHGGSMG